MARTIHESKPVGYEYWSRRAGPKMMSPGKSAKRLTHRAERRERRREIPVVHEAGLLSGGLLVDAVDGGFEVVQPLDPECEGE